MKLTDGQNFRISSRRLMTELGARFPARVLDLLRVAMGFYVADRLQKRDRRHPNGPSRDLKVDLPVIDVDFWRSTGITDLLVEIIELLCGDAAFPSFRQHRNKIEFQRPLFAEPWTPIDVVVPYSGGLDSAGGLASRLCRDDGLSRATVTACHQSGLRKIVRGQLDAFQQITGRKTPGLFVRASLINAPRMSEQELTQRCRGLLFMSLAGIVATQLGAHTVEIYENGIGAFNLPPMAGMALCGRSTRGCHPRFLRMMSELVSEVAGRPIQFILPFQNLTKAELVSEMTGNPRFEEIARSTVSCVHFPRRASKKQCGVCPGCLGRRQALKIARIDDPGSAYEHDIFSGSSALDRIPSEKLSYLKVTLLDVHKLQSLLEAGPPIRISSHIYGTSIAKVGEPIESWLKLLSRHRDEWCRLATEATDAGTAWGNWWPLSNRARRSAA